MNKEYIVQSVMSGEYLAVDHFQDDESYRMTAQLGDATLFGDRYVALHNAKKAGLFDGVILKEVLYV